MGMKRDYKPWTGVEQNRLKLLVEAGRSISTLARTFLRSEGSIQFKLGEMGLRIGGKHSRGMDESVPPPLLVSNELPEDLSVEAYVNSGLWCIDDTRQSGPLSESSRMTI